MCVVPTGLGTASFFAPALKRWAKLVRPSGPVFIGRLLPLIVTIFRFTESSRKIRKGEFLNAIARAFLDVVAVEPVQLLHIEDGGRRCDALQGKFLNQLISRKDFASPSRRSPAEEGQIVRQRFRKNSHVAKICDGSCAVTF